MPPDRPPATGADAPGNEEVLDFIRRVERVAEENRRLLQRLEDNEHRFRGLARSVWRVQEEERRHLARELHDGIGQLLVAVKTQLDRLRRQARDESLQQRLAQALELADHALQDTRVLSRLLRPPVLDDLGLPAALEWLARGLRERGGLEVRVRAELPGRLAPELETLVFRVAQETVSNTLKHAGARRLELALTLDPDGRLRLEISDDGCGFIPERAFRGEGLGLRGIRDRAEVFGGRLRIDSAPGAGCRLVLELTGVGLAKERGS